MARPKKYDIDTKVVEEFAALGAANTEIADFYGCDESLIRKSYSEFITKGRARGKMKLRQLQWKSAERLNPTVLIWLGKQLLGQTDKAEINWENPIDGIEFIDA